MAGLLHVLYFGKARSLGKIWGQGGHMDRIYPSIGTDLVADEARDHSVMQGY